MPAVAPGSKVLVTGANGYIAMWTVRKLLESGFSVRGTVRSTTKGGYITKMFQEYSSRLEIVIVPDIEVDGAFDEVVQGVDAIAHLASPYHFTADDPAEIILPASRGTLSLLQSTLRRGTAVKRIVITTSTAAVVQQTDLPQVFTENDWNVQAVHTVKAEGRHAPNYLKYVASKVIAEKAAFKFYEYYENNVNWDLTTIAPSCVFGPIINDVASLSAANRSVAELYAALLQGAKANDCLETIGNAWVDVRDVALAHVRAIQREEAVGRIIVSRGSFNWQDFVNVARALEPPPYTRRPIVEGITSHDTSKAVHCINFDTAKMERVLGMPVTSMVSMEQCTRDSLEDLQRKGW